MTKHFIFDRLIIMNNFTSKSKITKALRWWSIGLGILVLCVFVFLASRRDLSSFESILLQLISLAIGCGVSFWVGQQSNKKSLKGYARKASLYLISLSKSISRARAIASVGLPYRIESYDDYHVIRGALIAIFTEQLGRVNEELENSRDILEDELEKLIQSLQEDKITPEKLEDFIENLTYDNATEDN